MPLTTLGAKNAKPKEKPYKLADERGLYLLVTPAGGRLWRFKYRHAGKEKLLALGSFPDVSLAEARDAREDARRLLRADKDPSEHRRTLRTEARRAAGNSFEAVAREWLAKQARGGGVRGDRPRWSEKYLAVVTSRLEADVFPALGQIPVSAIRAADVLDMIATIEKRNAFQIAQRAQQYTSSIMRYAVVTSRAERDPAVDVRDALTRVSTKHHPAVTQPKEIGKLLLAVDGYWGMPQTRVALTLLAHTFVRPNELLRARWPEVDLKARLWTVPGERMKSRRPHLVPLTDQTVELFQQLEQLKTQDDGLVIPGRKASRKVCSSTLLAALRVMGYPGDVMVSHGFRSTASTRLHEEGFEIDVIEAQLAHSRPGVRGVYNRAIYLKERVEMMKWWSAYLGSLCELARKEAPSAADQGEGEQEASTGRPLAVSR
ncbi:tyrosine-type recombinase/integrase [Paraburkholderia sp. BR10936]|uniref:tyrosine-type recombinase/integrase n=1 Tax=Paraburkholderia sp. BR10936 TaxID=3236993 RepID=UPI0034D38D4E